MNHTLTSRLDPGMAAQWSSARQARLAPTDADAALWAHLRAHRMLGLKFRRQHVVGGLIADFYCHALKLVIVIESGARARENDRRQEALIAEHGLTVLRVSREDVLTKLSSVLAKIEIRCHQAMAG